MTLLRAFRPNSRSAFLSEVVEVGRLSVRELATNFAKFGEELAF
jgi:hypothetical protein